MTNHILKLTNVYYKKKYFLITNYKKKNLSKYLDNYKFLDSNINPTKIIDKPVFVINGLFNCFTHAIFDNIFSYLVTNFRGEYILIDYMEKIGNFNAAYIDSIFGVEGYHDIYNFSKDLFR